MVNKKLAALLATAVMLGQTSLVASHLAKADSQIAPKSPFDSLQVASVIPHTDIEPTSGVIHKKESTQDIYTIGSKPGQLPTLIQVLAQEDDTTSLFVNGAEILRFHGTLHEQDSYSRVKTVAESLKRILEEDPGSIRGIRAAMESVEDESQGQLQQAVVRMHDEVLFSVDPLTAFQAKEKQDKLAWIYANRLRQVLGVQPFKAESLNSQETADEHPAHATYKSTGRMQTGMASWYGGMFHGRRAADGSRFNQFALTAAHRSLPFGTMVKVVNHRTHQSCLVKITDRGPYAHGRIIDLSRGAAKAIGMLGSGVAKVSIEVMKHEG